jgi:hypothetical protein
MSKIVKVSQSDYRLKVKDSGTITLDTGLDVGLVVITGDLLVKGNTTTIDTANLQVEDNIILLNKGEGGAGVTEGTAGIQVDRGSVEDAQFLWDETIDKWVLVYAETNNLIVNGSFENPAITSSWGTFAVPNWTNLVDGNRIEIHKNVLGIPVPNGPLNTVSLTSNQIFAQIESSLDNLASKKVKVE